MGIDFEKLRAFVDAQELLLGRAALGPNELQAEIADYAWRHGELQKLLFASQHGCYCPWASLHAWPGMVAKRNGDVTGALGALRRELDDLLGTAVAKTPWTIRTHSRYLTDFYDRLDQRKQRLLSEFLEGELAVFGLDLLQDKTKLELCDCNRGGNVYEYKLQRKRWNTEFKLRVFFEAKPGKVLVLLHGLDKGHHDSLRNQGVQKEVACDRRSA